MGISHVKRAAACGSATAHILLSLGTTAHPGHERARGIGGYSQLGD
jgi:hypothetical protein